MSKVDYRNKVLPVILHSRLSSGRPPSRREN